MTDRHIIADASDALVHVLAHGLARGYPGAAPEVALHDICGAVPSSPACVTVFLYEVAEDPTQRSQALPQRDDSGRLVARPPMALILRYLLTPWAESRQMEQRLLGSTLEVLDRAAVLDAAAHAHGLGEGGALMRLSLNSVSVESQARIWRSVGRPYRLSLCYELRVVDVGPDGDDEDPSVAG